MKMKISEVTPQKTRISIKAVRVKGKNSLTHLAKLETSLSNLAFRLSRNTTILTSKGKLRVPKSQSRKHLTMLKSQKPPRRLHLRLRRASLAL